jgi:hypothetical protein
VLPIPLSSPENKNKKKAPPPFNSEGKIKDYSRMTFVLAAGSSQSFSRSIRTSFHYFIRSPHQLQHPTCKCFVPQHPHLSPPTATFPLIFTCELFAPKNRFPIIVALIRLD